MTEADAREELELDTDAASEPVLDAGDVSQLLASFVVTEPTSSGADDGEWNLNRAKAAGWRRKAGRTAGRFNFSADGRSFTASQFFDHCMRMAGLWESKADGETPEELGSVAVGVVTWGRPA